jgi:hypothetical protein
MRAAWIFSIGWPAFAEVQSPLAKLGGLMRKVNAAVAVSALSGGYGPHQRANA